MLCFSCWHYKPGLKRGCICRNACVGVEAGKGDYLFVLLASAAVRMNAAEQQQLLAVGVDTIKVQTLSDDMALIV